MADNFAGGFCLLGWVYDSSIAMLVSKCSVAEVKQNIVSILPDRIEMGSVIFLVEI